jgi:excinuclease UvrABC nuclease subunit
VKEYIKSFTKSKNGIYIYKDSGDNILYIGKAKPLTDRIYHHFKETFVQQSGDRSGKWFRFFNYYQGILTVYWKEIEDEAVRVFIESILTDKYQPKFLAFEKLNNL